MQIINCFKKVLIELLQFMKNPKDERTEDKSFRKKAIYFLSFFLIEIIIFFCLLEPLYMLIDYINSELIVSDSMIKYNQNTIVYQIIVVTILVPLLEELIFRGFLRYNSLICKKETWDKGFKYLVYISIISFGLIHIYNFEGSSFLFYVIAPLLVVSQMFGGIILSFLRVKYNLRTSILYHSMWNLVIGILLPLFLIQFEKPYELNNKNYSVKIEHLAFCDLDKQKREINSKNNIIYKLKFEDYSINHILDSVCNYKNNKEDYLINIELESKKGIDKDKVKNILLKYYKEEFE